MGNRGGFSRVGLLLAIPILPIVVAASSGAPRAATYEVIHSFGGEPGAGRGSQARLLIGSDGALYATARNGGLWGGGTVFKVNTDGTGLAVLRNLLADDGIAPFAGVIQGSDGSLYGTVSADSPNFQGGVFRMSIDGTGYTVLKSLDVPLTIGGAEPRGEMIQGTDGALYGTTNRGGTSFAGTVFKLNIDGTGFTVLKHLTTASTGGRPSCGLVQGADGALYGTTDTGGSGGSGTVFKLNTDGTGFTVLKNFSSPTTGASPSGGLIQGSDGILYGTTVTGGSAGGGTVFKLNTDGTGFTLLANLSAATTGSAPRGVLMEGLDGALYGTASQGGTGASGTVFRLNRDGTGFSVLQHFTSSTTGKTPLAGLVQGPDGTLYGTTSAGSPFLSGKVFSIQPDGSGFTVLLTLASGPDTSTGAFPLAGVIQGTDGALYGATWSGGSQQAGTVFKLNTDGTGFTVLVDFDYEVTGISSYSGVIQGIDGALYGITYEGGANLVGRS